MNLKQAWIHFLNGQAPPEAHMSTSESGETCIFEFHHSQRKSRFGIVSTCNGQQCWFYVDISDRNNTIMESGELNISELLIAGLSK